ncbi:Hint domain-containing protein [Defluviimonas sp. WL0002]|uniref:Hint domain-containing protein n=1 Tax=Albidovulum marisflavi TaxID=2984159 RepID=A0ABT2Z7J6_9RHOB|nr:Hint domain-containing protein [Defluviimonas sp. WL0002]MCV2867062.1 Hint domain-containing protein [Defluviimonas sp. WL0002]
MSWLVVADHAQGRTGVQPVSGTHKAGVGSLVWEFDFASLPAAPQLLYQARSRNSLLTLSLIGGDKVHLMLRAGDRYCQIATGYDRPAARGALRMTLRWDCRAGEATLTAENLAQGTLRQSSAEAVPALSGDEIVALSRHWGHRHPALRWHAASDHLHPIGPGICMAGQTPIPTAHGAVPLSSLRAGDRVATREGGFATVLWCGAVEVPALGSYAPIRLKAPPFGHGGDLVVQPGHRVVLSGADIEYLFGETEILVEAGTLIDGETVLPEPAGPLFTYHGLLLDDHHIIAPGGCAIESLCIGRLARDRDLAMTTALADLVTEGMLPVQRRTALRDAQGYEADALAMTRRATRSLFAA